MFIFMVSYCNNLNGFSGKCAVIVFYALREIYISLLSSQQWAFISTTLDKSTSTYLVSFSGIVSVASAIGGCTVENLVSLGGVKGLLLTSLVATVIGLLTSEIASAMALKYQKERELLNAQKQAAGLSPYHTPKQSSENLIKLAKNTSTKFLLTKNQSATKHAQKQKQGFWKDSWELFCNYPILQILFFEAITHQTCTNMLNIMFHNSLRAESMDNELKAKLVGRFFATVSVVSCGLQCFVLPTMLTQQSLPRMLMYLPCTVFATVMIGVVHPGLVSVMLGYGTMKVLEYSMMHSASEMIYVPLGHEVRYVGKELIKFFGHKLGKSAASLALSYLISRNQPSLMFQSIWGGAFSIVWAVSIFWLCIHLVERNNAEEKMTSTSVHDALYGATSAVISSEPMKGNETEKRNTSQLRYRFDSGRKTTRQGLPTSTSMPIFEIPAPASTASMTSLVSDKVADGTRSRGATEDETTVSYSESAMAPFWMSDSEDSNSPTWNEKRKNSYADNLATYLADMCVRRAHRTMSSSAADDSNPGFRYLSGSNKHSEARSLSFSHEPDKGDEISSMSSWFSETSRESDLSLQEWGTEDGEDIINGKFRESDASRDKSSTDNNDIRNGSEESVWYAKGCKDKDV
jgi:ATP/ADP translocase